MTADGADFAPQRIRGGRRAPPLVGWLVALGIVIAIGMAGQVQEDAPDGPAAAPRFEVELVIPAATRAGAAGLSVPSPGAESMAPEFLRGFRPTGPPWNRQQAGG